MLTRRYLVVGVLTLGCLGAAPAGVALAGPPAPLVAPSCTAVVEGATGQGVLLDPRAVGDPIAESLKPLDPLGTLGGPFHETWNASPPIPVGSVPDGEAVISGTQIADAAVERLRQTPVVAPVLDRLIPAVHSTLSAACRIVARDDQPGAPGTGGQPVPAQPRPPSPPPPSTGPHWDPPKSWSDSQSSGDPVRFGAPVTGMWPWAASDSRVVGVLETRALGGRDVPVWNSQTKLSAGRADALPAERNRPPVTELLAVLLLTFVSAQLVRRWVLRSDR